MPPRKLKPKSGKSFGQRIKGGRKSTNVQEAGSRASQIVKAVGHTIKNVAKENMAIIKGTRPKLSPRLKANLKADVLRTKMKSRRRGKKPLRKNQA